MRTLSAQEKRWVLMTVVVAAGAAAYVWMLEPLISNASSGGQKLESKKNAFEKNLKSLAQYEALRAEYERVAAEAPVLAGGEDVTGSLGNLEKIAGECSVTLASIKPQIFEEEDGSKCVLFDISASADALSLTRFLYRVETSPYLLRIKRFSVTPASQSEGALQCTLLVSQLSPSL